MNAVFLNKIITTRRNSGYDHQHSDHYKSNGPPGQPEFTIFAILIFITWDIKTLLVILVIIIIGLIAPVCRLGRIHHTICHPKIKAAILTINIFCLGFPVVALLSDTINIFVLIAGRYIYRWERGHAHLHVQHI